MVFLQCKNLINTAWWIWTGDGKHTNRYFISGSQSFKNWYDWKGRLICHWVYLCLPSHSRGVKQNTIRLCLPHKGLQLQNLSLSSRSYRLAGWTRPLWEAFKINEQMCSLIVSKIELTQGWGEPQSILTRTLFKYCFPSKCGVSLSNLVLFYNLPPLFDFKLYML